MTVKFYGKSDYIVARYIIFHYWRSNHSKKSQLAAIRISSRKYALTILYFKTSIRNDLENSTNKTMLISIEFLNTFLYCRFTSMFIIPIIIDVHFKHPIFILSFKGFITGNLILNQCFRRLTRSWTSVKHTSVRLVIFITETNILLYFLKRDSCFQLFVTESYEKSDVWRV